MLNGEIANLSTSLCCAVLVIAARYFIMILLVSVFPAPDSPERVYSKTSRIDVSSNCDSEKSGLGLILLRYLNKHHPILLYRFKVQSFVSTDSGFRPVVICQNIRPGVIVRLVPCITTSLATSNGCFDVVSIE